MKTKPTYKKGDCFIYSSRVKTKGPLLFMVDSIVWSAKNRTWLYRVFYPETKEYRSYFTPRLKNECKKLRGNTKTLAKLLYERV